MRYTRGLMLLSTVVAPFVCVAMDIDVRGENSSRRHKWQSVGDADVVLAQMTQKCWFFSLLSSRSSLDRFG